MKRKEVKVFVRRFKEGSCEFKIKLVTELFHSIVSTFELTAKRSHTEIVGFVQRANAFWKDICGMLPPVKDDLYFNDYAMVEFFFKNVQFVSKNLYTRKTLELMMVSCNLSPELLFEESEYYAEIEYTTNA